jgi:hypothetical protein
MSLLEDPHKRRDERVLSRRVDIVIGRVDIVIERSLSPHFRPHIQSEARPL